MSDRKSLQTRFVLWILWLLWRLIKWSVLSVYFRCLPHHMHMAPSQEAIDNFYKNDKKWAKLSLQAKDKYGFQCMKCKKNPTAYPRLRLVTDHIKPVRFYWHLRYDPDNHQVLCDGCNKAKGSFDMTDYRGYRPGKTPLPQSLPVPRRRIQIVTTSHASQRGWLA